MYGIDEVLRLCIVALYTDGHVLLEGNPGLGKTELVKTIGRLLKLPFGRIQFTPDLMPADITGTYMPDFENRQKLTFQPGPIFTSLLLADEINRATPKTQSAMLEAMAEHQVTVLGQRHPLGSPFFVLATQNPIDHEGTYTLPEAQADRFMFKINMPVPGSKTLDRILRKCAGTTVALPQEGTLDNNDHVRLLPHDQDDSQRKYEEMKQRIGSVEPLPSLEVHVRNMFLASNGLTGELEGLDSQQIETLKQLRDLLIYGLGPRASIAMMLGAKAWSLMFLENSENAEGPALARVVIPILRHRIKPVFDWEDRFQRIGRRSAGKVTLESMLMDFCVAAAPGAHEYRRTFEVALRRNLIGTL